MKRVSVLVILTVLSFNVMAQRTILLCGKLIDVNAKKVLENVSVVIE
jgi:hypothetical protein